MVYFKFTAFIVASIIATPVPYYNTETKSIGQDKSANDFNQAYNTGDMSKAVYDDVKAITGRKQAYGAQEQATGDMTSAYSSAKSTDGVMGDGQVKPGNENKQAYGAAKPIEEIMSYEEWKAINEPNYAEEMNNKNGNQAYSSGMTKELKVSNKHGNEGRNGMDRNNQGWSYMSSGNQAWKGMNHGSREWNYMTSDIQVWKDMGRDNQRWNHISSNNQKWEKNNRNTKDWNAMDNKAMASTSQRNEGMSQSMGYTQKH